MSSEASTEIEDLLAKAMELHRGGQLTKAEWAYEEVLEKDPKHPSALQLLGVIAAQMGNTTLAIERVNQSIEINPDQPVALNNLGNMLAQEERFDEAIDVYRRAIELKPDYSQVHYNLGKALGDHHQPLEAVDALSRAVDLDPQDADSWYAFAASLETVARFEDAVLAYRKAKAIAPDFVGALNRLGAVLRKMDCLDEAREVYQEWLEMVPGDPIASHFLLVCSGAKETPDRASPEYVKLTFNNIADEFDGLLSDLDYRVPDLIGQMIGESASGTLASETPAGQLSVVDLGCGTGLCGSHLRGHAQRLIGVDLSPAMLAKADERDLYDELVEAELTSYLDGCSGEHDLLVSADTLIYVGDLRSTFAAAANALRPGGRFLFSLEKFDSSDRDDDSDTCGFQLSSSGRYAHDETAVRRWLSDNGFTVDQWSQSKARDEGNSEIIGFLVAATRQ